MELLKLRRFFRGSLYIVFPVVYENILLNVHVFSAYTYIVWEPPYPTAISGGVKCIRLMYNR